ncbi:MAG TPA: hypothetical protein VGB78_08760 [Thermoplasmata archaeon]
MRVLVSAYEDGDLEKVLLAMRSLPYDQLVIVGQGNSAESKGLETIKELEEMAGHMVIVETLADTEFLPLVDAFTELISTYSTDARTRTRNRVTLNISGGSRLLGAASLFAAFRLGVEAYHCDGTVTKLPIMKDVRPTSVFTEAQTKLLCSLCQDWLTLDEIVARAKPPSRQAGERVLRELRKYGLLRAKVEGGRILLALSDAGAEAQRIVHIAEPG